MVESQSFVDLHDCTCVRSCSVHEDGPRWGLGPPGPVLLLSLLLYITLYIYIYIYSYNIFLLCNWHLQKP